MPSAVSDPVALCVEESPSLSSTSLLESFFEKKKSKEFF
jgi:hypothetical protein